MCKGRALDGYKRLCRRSENSKCIVYYTAKQKTATRMSSRAQKANKKNNFKAPVCKDRRLLLVPAKCGRCIECRKGRKREWVIRLNEEIKNNPDKATFWTLTISNGEYEKLKSDSKKKDRDSICKLAVKRMLERIRKKTKKSVRPGLS